MQPLDHHVPTDDLDRLKGQNAEVLAAMQAGRILTHAVAWEEMRIARLGARVWDLRQHGVPVLSKRDPVRKCSVYWMEVRK